MFTVRQQEQSAEEVDKLLKAWRRRAEKIRQKMAARITPQLDSESSVKTDSQAGTGSCAVSSDRKRKERDGDSAGIDVNEPLTSSNVKRTRMSCDGDHQSDRKNFDFQETRGAGWVEHVSITACGIHRTAQRHQGGECPGEAQVNMQE